MRQISQIITIKKINCDLNWYLLKTFKDRFLQLLDFKGVKRASELAKICNFTHSSARNYMNGKSEPSFENLLAIKKNFENINLNWLVSGEGSMLLESNNYNIEEGNALNIASEPGKDNLQARIKDLEQENKMLKGVINKFLGEDNGHNGKSAIG